MSKIEVLSRGEGNDLIVQGHAVIGLDTEYSSDNNDTIVAIMKIVTREGSVTLRRWHDKGIGEKFVLSDFLNVAQDELEYVYAHIYSHYNKAEISSFDKEDLFRLAAAAAIQPDYSKALPYNHSLSEESVGELFPSYKIGNMESFISYQQQYYT